MGSFTSTRLSILAAAAVIGMAGIGCAAAGGNADRAEYQARQQIDRSFDLAPGAKVDVSSIAGPVTIEAGAGNHAEVHILNMARNQRELDCIRIDIEGSAQALKVKRVDAEDRGACRNVRARQEVRLVVPRSVALTLSSVAGSIDVAALDGPVRLHSIAGRATLAGARSADISSVAGKLSLGVSAVAPSGIRISSVAGAVDLALRPGTNADVEISSVVGSVRSETPDLRLVEQNHGYRARLGTGGPRLSISSVVGPVRLKIS
jgi:hypothetical protein